MSQVVVEVGEARVRADDHVWRQVVSPVTGYFPVAGALRGLAGADPGWNPNPGVQEAFFASRTIECFGTFSRKAWHNVGRPRGMSTSHWRKVRRERRLDLAVDIHVAPDTGDERP